MHDSLYVAAAYIMRYLLYIIRYMEWMVAADLDIGLGNGFHRYMESIPFHPFHVPLGTWDVWSPHI